MHSCYNFNCTKALLHVLACDSPSSESQLQITGIMVNYQCVLYVAWCRHRSVDLMVRRVSLVQSSLYSIFSGPGGACQNSSFHFNCIILDTVFNLICPFLTNQGRETTWNSFHSYLLLSPCALRQSTTNFQTYFFIDQIRLWTRSKVSSSLI